MVIGNSKKCHEQKILIMDSELEITQYFARIYKSEQCSDPLPVKTVVDLWSNIIAMKLPSPQIPLLLEPFLFYFFGYVLT